MVHHYVLFNGLFSKCAVLRPSDDRSSFRIDIPTIVQVCMRYNFNIFLVYASSCHVLYSSFGSGSQLFRSLQALLYQQLLDLHCGGQPYLPRIEPLTPVSFMLCSLRFIFPIWSTEIIFKRNSSQP